MTVLNGVNFTILTVCGICPVNGAMDYSTLNSTSRKRHYFATSRGYTSAVSAALSEVRDAVFISALTMTVVGVYNVAVFMGFTCRVFSPTTGNRRIA